MTTSDLRWLVKRGCLSHAREITALQDMDRHFEPPEQNLVFAGNTCFVLTDAGLAVLGRDNSQATQLAQVDKAPGEMPIVAWNHSSAPAAMPNWDRGSRAFVVGEYLIKRFRVPSPNQETVLNAFQEEGWPAAIDDPLPPVRDYVPSPPPRHDQVPESEPGHPDNSFPRRWHGAAGALGARA